MLFTVAEAAEALGMGRSTLYTAIKSGSCPLVVTRIGKQLPIVRWHWTGLPEMADQQESAIPEDHASFCAVPCPTCGRPSSSSRPTNSAAFWSSSVTASV